MSRKRRTSSPRPVPVSTHVPGQLEFFAVGRTRVRPVGCESPDTCTDHDPCPHCLASARTAELSTAGESGHGRNDR